jgi:hypothetical protein
MAKRLRDICKLPEDETQWRAGRGFIVRDLPWTEKQLREIPPFEFENWAVIALGGIPNKTQVGDMGIDGRIYPVGAIPKASDKHTGELDFMDECIRYRSALDRALEHPPHLSLSTNSLRLLRNRISFSQQRFLTITGHSTQNPSMSVIEILQQLTSGQWSSPSRHVTM